jgi:hypothetical protein
MGLGVESAMRRQGAGGDGGKFIADHLFLCTPFGAEKNL